MVVSQVSVFNFSSHTHYLAAVTERHLQRSKRGLTASAWATRLGYRSAQSVTMVLNGQRLPGSEMLERIAADLHLTTDEHRYLELLVLLEKNKRSGKSIQRISDELQRLNPNFARQISVDTTTFSYIAEWYHLVIEQLVGGDEFKEDPMWIRERLRRKASEHEIQMALATLTRLGFVVRDPITNRLQRSAHGLKTTSGIPSEAIRLHHKQMLNRALESVDEQPLAERETTSLTLRFSKHRVAEAKEFLQSIKDLFNERFYDDSSEDIFQLNIQLFNHTTPIERTSKNG